ncbi:MULTISPECIES: AMP-binding protein [Mesorhizobium]|uniref:AMP-binding protein n=1 Tax=Mesorhizobium TaxID=68287 RepID=UPI0010A97176|nr:MULTISPECIES: AMP-binding protein [Mesorhizobium]
MVFEKDSFEEVRRSFQWSIPERFNIGVDICDKWAEADPTRLAIVDVDPASFTREYTFADLRTMSNRLANALSGHGVGRQVGETGDRVGVLLPQRVETAVAHIAVTKLGCVSIPLFTLFGPEALEHRLRDSGARVVITDRAGAERVASIRSRVPSIELVVCVDGRGDGDEVSFQEMCSEQSDMFIPVDTHSDDPAILIYTSGTTGNPKGALHAHRVLLGHLPGVEISHNFLPKPGDRFWTPADWAWIGGLLDVLMPALHHGIPVVACRFSKFTTEAAITLIRSQRIRNVFLPPTALKMLKLKPAEECSGLDLRSVASGGETLGAELIQWGKDALGVTINEFYGQTECNMIVSSCAALEPPALGSMGRPVPGHDVDVFDPVSGLRQPAGVEGAIAALAPDPVMFLGYWNNPDATREKFIHGPEGRWLVTGDRGVRDNDGRLRFVGRDDDVIGSAGYRIGPAEIEDCLLGHPSVRLAGAVGKPDEIRGSVVAAYVVLREGFSPSQNLAEDIAAHVKSRLAAHEYPRVVRFIDEMPMTTTGKIIRGELRKMAQEEAALEARSRQKD